MTETYAEAKNKTQRELFEFKQTAEAKNRCSEACKGVIKLVQAKKRLNADAFLANLTLH